MPRLAYRLSTLSETGFHLGREGLGQETSADSFPSDSLFSAILATVAEVYGVDAVETLVAAIQADHVLRVSSVFPLVGQLPLFPFPRLHVELAKREIRVGKRLKKLRYVSKGILQRLLTAQPMDDWLPSEAPNKGLVLNGGQVWIAADEQAQLPAGLATLPHHALGETRLWKTGTVPRVTIDRVSNASAVYQVGRTVFAEGCGLWFLADVVEAYADMLDVVVHVLGDSGIGGERSAGYGKFAPERMPAPDLADPARHPRAMALSRYHPRLDELEAGVLTGDVAYDLVDIGGWLYSPGQPAQRRQRIRMLEVGSVVNTSGGVPTGQIRDVRPHYEAATFPHPIYRSGMAIFVGVPGGNG